MPDDTQTDLTAQLTSDMKTALKAGEKEKLSVIRMLLAEARSADMQNPPSTPLKMVQAYHKRLAKSRDEYVKIGDNDQLAKLNDEMKVVAAYLPAQADAGETIAKVDKFLDEHPEFSPRDIGKATGGFMKQCGGGVDAKAANTRIREVLAARA